MSSLPPRQSNPARAHDMYITAYMAVYMPLYVVMRAHAVMVGHKVAGGRKCFPPKDLHASRASWLHFGRNLAIDAHNLAFWLRNLANSGLNLAISTLTSQPFCCGARTYVNSARLRPDHATHMRARAHARTYIAHIEVAGK